MKKQIIVFTFCLCSIFALTQTKKTYSGEYTAGGSGSKINLEFFKGTSNYSYFENENLERIYSGNFSYTGKQMGATWDGRSTGESTTVTINGTYKDHLKEGVFTTKTAFKSSSFSGSAICKTAYSMGYADGLWSISEPGESKSVTFKNNIGIGPFKYKTKELTISGNLNNEGYFNGEVKFIEGKWESIITYENGFQLKFVSRNTQTGQISENTETEKEKINYYNQIRDATANGDNGTLENIPYKIVPSYHYGVYNKYNASFKDYNYPGATPGDLSATQDYEHNYTWKAFLTKTLVRQETRDERIERERKEQETKIRKEIKDLLWNKKYDEASKIYYNQEVFSDNELKQDIFNGLEKAHSTDTLLVDQDFILKFINDNPNVLNSLENGSYNLVFSKTGSPISDIASLKKINSEIPKAEINGFKVPVNIMININIETKSKLIETKYFSGNNKTLYHDNYETFYSKSKVDPELEYEFNENVSKKIVNRVQTYELLKYSNDVFIGSTKETKNKDFELIKR